MNAAGQATYFFQDALGSVGQVIDQAGAVVRTNFTDAWGAPLAVGLPAPPVGLAGRWGYTGRERDDVSGLMHYRARTYDPAVGRFTSRDPVWHSNLYLNVDNNPVNWGDPLGLISGAEAARLKSLADAYGGLGADHLSELYAGLLWHEQHKDDLARGDKDTKVEWDTIVWFKAEIAKERDRVLRKWAREEADLLGEYYRNTAHDIATLSSDDSRYVRKVWEFETALVMGSAHVLAIQEAQWRSSVAAFGVHVAAWATSAVGLQRPTQIPGPQPPCGASSFKPPAAVTAGGGQGFKSFGELKAALGPAGPGHAWHHIVEQTAGNVARFGDDAIHNTANVVRVPHGAGSIHEGISAFYSSAQPHITGSTSMTVRQWLSTKTFAEQASFGKMVLEVFTKGLSK